MQKSNQNRVDNKQLIQEAKASWQITNVTELLNLSYTGGTSSMVSTSLKSALRLHDTKFFG